MACTSGPGTGNKNGIADEGHAVRLWRLASNRSAPDPHAGHSNMVRRPACNRYRGQRFPNVQDQLARRYIRNMPKRAAKNQKPITDDRTYVADQKAVGDGERLSQVELESIVSSRADRKGSQARFGSLVKQSAYLRATSECREMIDDLRVVNELRGGFQNALRKPLAALIARMADVPWWTALATRDLKEFRSQQKAVLCVYKKLLNGVCGIQSHRPTNEAQTFLILEIKLFKPDWSFGQVAHEYTRRTGKRMTPKIAERTFARAKPGTFLFLERSFTPVIGYLKLFQNAANALISLNTTKA